MTSTSYIAGADVIAAVRRLASEYPDNVYDLPSDDAKCSNVDGSCTNGTQGCIVGQALVACGIDRAELAKTCPHGSARDALLKMEIPFTNAECNWLVRVQEWQDSHFTWKYAVENTDY